MTSNQDTQRLESQEGPGFMPSLDFDRDVLDIQIRNSRESCRKGREQPVLAKNELRVSVTAGWTSGRLRWPALTSIQNR